jgi:UDP-N-acetylmuramyl pentapeptide phosphotransferase/UDP-N-acetylglucosamine-1-phosphate transferase
MTQRVLWAYTLAQITVGIQLGVAIAVAIVVYDLPLPAVLAFGPLGLPLVALQSVLAHRMLVGKASPKNPSG